MAWGSAVIWKPEPVDGAYFLEPSPPYRLVIMARRPGAIAIVVVVWGNAHMVERLRGGQDPRFTVRELPGIVRGTAHPSPGDHRFLGGSLAAEGRGWPYYALSCKTDSYDFGRSREVVSNALCAFRPDRPPSDATLLPYLPYWPGLLADTLFYAVLLACLHQLNAWGHRTRRRKRGRCAACGYDLSGLDSFTCPECGRDR